MNMYKTCLTRVGTILLLSTPIVTNIAVGDQPAENKQPVEGLIAACQDAKSQFRPLTKEDQKAAKDELVAALAKLDVQLKSAGANGEDWRKFLLWDELQQELQKEGGENQAVLNRVCERYASGSEGLGLVWFIDVRSALWRLLKVDEAIGNDKTKTTYESILDNLGNNLKTFAAKPTTENTLGISESIRWLQIRSQAPELVQAVEGNSTSRTFSAKHRPISPPPPLANRSMITRRFATTSWELQSPVRAIPWAEPPGNWFRIRTWE